MAERRMFAKSIIHSDVFLEMPLSTQALYFHLAEMADDDGFVTNPKRVMRMVGADEDSMKILIAKRFLLLFESGVIVIRHWRVHNYIRKDRYKETICKLEKRTLALDEDGAYLLCDQLTDNTPTMCQSSGQPVGIPCGQPTVSQVGDPGKVRLGKDRLLVNVNDEMPEKNQLKLSTLPSNERSVHVRANDEEFERLWRLYPRKQGKDVAKKAYAKAIRNGTSNEVIESGIERYCRYIKANNIELQYIKQGSTWFNQACWNDDYSEAELKGADNKQKKKSSYDINKVKDYAIPFEKGENES